MSRVFLSPPHMSDDALAMLRNAFDSNWIAPAGPDIEAFEREVAQYVGVKAACAVSCGTAAIHLALRCLGVGPGDTVFCSSLTFCASINPVFYQGATAVFVDSNPESWNMNPQLLREELDRRALRGCLPRAVVVVDLYGQCADYGPILAVCEEHGVPVVEDAAEALGATYHGRRAGTFGRCAVLSFNGNKIITASSGGMLLSDDEALIARAKFLATQARDAAPHYQHSEIGYNYRLSNLLAALGRSQLRVIDARVASRRANFTHYRDALSDLPGIDFMPEATYGIANRWLTVVTIDPIRFGVTREQIRAALETADIEARPVWKPLHVQPAYRDCPVIGGQVAEQLFERGLCLPSGSNLDEKQRNRIIEVVRGQYRSANR